MLDDGGCGGGGVFSHSSKFSFCITLCFFVSEKAGERSELRKIYWKTNREGRFKHSPLSHMVLGSILPFDTLAKSLLLQNQTD